MKLIDKDKLQQELWDTYCHYACNGLDIEKSADLNVAMCTVELQDEIEAIPVEFIETWIKRAFWDGKITANSMEVYTKMVEDWNKSKVLVSPFNDD